IGQRAFDLAHQVGLADDRVEVVRQPRRAVGADADRLVAGGARGLDVVDRRRSAEVLRRIDQFIHAPPTSGTPAYTGQHSFVFGENRGAVLRIPPFRRVRFAIHDGSGLVPDRLVP